MKHYVTCIVSISVFVVASRKARKFLAGTTFVQIKSTMSG